MTANSHRSLAFGALLLTLGVALYGLTPLADYDVWWHLRTGAELWRTGTTLPTDPFSFTHLGAPWPYIDAGAALLMFALWQAFGPVALVIQKALLLGLTVLCLWRTLALRRVPPHLALGLLALAVAAFEFRFVERPAVYSFCATAAALFLLERARHEHRGLAWLLPLLLVTANLHRGVLLVPLLVAAWALCLSLEARLRARRGTSTALSFIKIADAPPQQKMALSAWVVATAAASLATPFGVSALTQSLAILQQRSAFRGRIPEWEPLSAQGVLAATPATLGVALLAAVALWLLLKHKQLSLWDSALLLLAVAVGATGIRFLAYGVLFSLPVIGSGLGLLGELDRPRVRPILALGACAALLLAALSTAPEQGVAAGLFTPILPRRFPQSAVAFVRQEHSAGRLQGRMLNDFGLGGYLIHELWPTFSVYVDGRNDLLYSAEFMARYPRVLADPAVFAEEVARYDIEWLFLHNRPWASERAFIDRDPAWRLVFASEQALIYVRQNGKNQALANALGYRLLKPHALLPSVVQTWQTPSERPALEAEVTRLVNTDADSIPALVAWAALLEQKGDHAAQAAVLDRLVSLGYRPGTGR